MMSTSSPTRESTTSRAGIWLTKLVAIGTVLSLPSWWIATSYLHIDVPASLMFFGQDGWCDPGTEGVGVHCFGDFSERWLIDTSLPPPWPNNLEMSPVGPAITLIANVAADVVNARIVLAAVIVIYAAAILTPWLWMLRLSRFREFTALTVLISFSAYPFLALMDRLNNLALVVPLLTWMTVSFLRRRYSSVAVSIIAISLIKPPLLILALLLLAARRVGHLLMTVGTAVALVAIAIVAAGAGDMDRLRQYVVASRNYAAAFDGIESFPQVNVSLSKALYLFLNYLDASLLRWLDVQPNLANFVIQRSLVIQIGLVGLVALGLLLLGNRMSRGSVLAVVLPTAFLALGNYVAGYYLVFALVLAAVVVLRGWSDGKPNVERLALSAGCATSDAMTSHESPRHVIRVPEALVVIAVALSLVPILLPLPMAYGDPWPDFVGQRVTSAMPHLAAIVWLAVLIWFFIRSASYVATAAQGRVTTVR